MKILVIGATGQQGGTAVDAALAGDHSVRALVRDPSNPRAVALADRGVELVVGSLDELDSVRAAMTGVDAAFAMTTMTAGLDVEVRHGKVVVDAAGESGLGHLVFSSVASAGQGTGIGHFDSKWEIEEYLRESDVPATVIAPTFFYDNFLFPWNVADLERGVLRQAMPLTTKLQMVAAADIGRFAVYAMEAGLVGQRVELLGAELTGPEVAVAIGDALGRSVAYERQPLAELEAMGDMARMYEWFVETGYDVSAGQLAADHPSFRFTGFDEWAKGVRWPLRSELAS